MSAGGSGASANHQLSEVENQRIFEQRIRPNVFAGALPAERPVAIVFGGQPGAGKSRAVDEAVRELRARGSAAQIVGDELRTYHPQYERLLERDDKTVALHTGADSARWVEKSIAHAAQQKINVVIEGTMRDSNKVAATMRLLRNAGFEIDARVLAVSEQSSWQGVLQRYEAQKEDRGVGRMTAPSAHRVAYDAVPVTVARIEQEKLADQLTVYRRNGDPIYRNALRDGNWEREPIARNVIEKERARPMTVRESVEHADGYARLAAMVARPERGASEEERQSVYALAVQAKRDALATALRSGDRDAVKKMPELKGSWDVLDIVAQKAEQDGLLPSAKAHVMARARDALAARIERGELPDASQRGRERSVRMSGSRLLLRHDGAQWNVKAVEADR